MRKRERDNSEDTYITFDTSSGTVTAVIPGHVMGRPYRDATVTDEGAWFGKIVQWNGCRRPPLTVAAKLDGKEFTVDIPVRDWNQLAGHGAWGTGDYPQQGYLPGQAEYFEDMLNAVKEALSAIDVEPCSFISVFGPSTYERKTTYDVETENFQSKRAAGQLVFNPFVTDELRYKSTWSEKTIEAAKVYTPPSSYPGMTPRSWGGSNGMASQPSWYPQGTGLSPPSYSGIQFHGEYKDMGQFVSQTGASAGRLDVVSRYSPEVHALLDRLMSSQEVIDRVINAPLSYSDVSGSSLEEVYDRINDSEAEIATELLELPETLKHLYSVINRFTTLVKTIKRPAGLKKLCKRTWSKAKRELRRKLQRSPTDVEVAAYIYSDLFSSAWLEARYAWRPLIISAEQIIRGYDLDRPPRHTFWGLRSSQDSSSVESDHWSGIRSAKSGALCEAGNLSSGNVLGLFNFGTAALELIPFSFIVGWFVNLSAVAASLNPSPIYTARGSWTTERTTTDFTFIVCNPDDYSLLDGIVTEPIMVTGTAIRQTRVINPSRSFFSIDLNLDGSKFTDLAAILRQLAS